ncbi:MAG: hypothetical protein ACJA0U_000602 [Salibacteraceae bacterium]
MNVAFGLLNKRINDESYTIEESKVRSLQIVASLDLNIGYLFDLKRGLKISPIAGIHYSPCFIEGQSEIVINKTSTLVEEQDNSFFKFGIGLRIHLSK